MSEAPAHDDLGEFEDAVDAAPTVADLADVFTQAKADATLPKPTIEEMILEVTAARGAIEDRQFRALVCGFQAAPDKGAMRAAAVLAAAVNFLLLIEAKQAAVKRVLR